MFLTGIGFPAEMPGIRESHFCPHKGGGAFAADFSVYVPKDKDRVSIPAHLSNSLELLRAL